MFWLMPLSLLSQSQEPKHPQLAESFVGVKEVTNNSSPEINVWLKYVNLRPGSPYCAAFVSYCIGTSGAKEPNIRSGLARNFITKKSIPASKVLLGIVKIEPGTILVWRRGNTIFGHTGFVKEWGTTSGTTIEANTSSGNQGSQSNGDGVYIRQRTIVPGASFRITDFTPVTY